jgi:hypothetical protein
LNVVSLFKSADKSDISNYRGISILWAIPKLFEKLVCDVITLIIRPSISNEQHGFVGGRSTVISPVDFSNFVLSEMEDGLQVDAVYTDFSKAFDCSLFQQDLGWCCEERYDFNSGKLKFILFSRGSEPVIFQYLIGNSDLERVDVINDLDVLVDNRMTFVDQIGAMCRNELECWDL